jgi:hypothetical protein
MLSLLVGVCSLCFNLDSGGSLRCCFPCRSTFVVCASIEIQVGLSDNAFLFGLLKCCYRYCSIFSIENCFSVCTLFDISSWSTLVSFRVVFFTVEFAVEFVLSIFLDALFAASVMETFILVYLAYAMFSLRFFP